MTLYLSKLMLNTRNWNARRVLGSAYEMHRTLMRAFPSKEAGGPGRVLFRVEPIRDDVSPVVLVQSDKQPNWSRLEPDWAAGDPQVKTFLPRFVVDQNLAFRLRANPTVRRNIGSDKPDGKRRGLLTEPAQLAWLDRKARSGGFGVRSVRMTVEGIQHTGRGKADESPLRHFAVRFDGLLIVADTALFLKSIEAGIGSAKGFGFGLLSLAPPP